MQNQIFFRRFLNVTGSVVVDFSVGVFEGVILGNFTTTGQADGLIQVGGSQLQDMLEQKTKKVIAIAAGGAMAKTASIVCKVGGTIASATPNLWI